MKKFIKTASLVVSTYSIAEMVTLYRLDPQGLTLAQYTKKYIKQAAAQAVLMGKRNYQLGYDGDFKGAFRASMNDLFPNK